MPERRHEAMSHAFHPKSHSSTARSVDCTAQCIPRTAHRSLTVVPKSKRTEGDSTRGLTFDMSGGAKGAKRPLGRPLDGGVRFHDWRLDRLDIETLYDEQKREKP